MATILQRVGWRVAVLEGGYRTYRRHVQDRLYDQGCGLNLILLDGDTGSAKTEVLNRLAGYSVQVLDLEALAGHRGSLFGGLAGQRQPSQKMFESNLLAALDGLDASRPVVVEAESSKIGDRMIPPALWRAMQQAPRIEIAAPREARARYLVSAYADLLSGAKQLEATIARLPSRPSPKRFEAWMSWLRAGEFIALAEALIAFHYDPAYARSRRREVREPIARLEADDLTEHAQKRLAYQIARLIAKGAANPQT